MEPIVILFAIAGLILGITILVKFFAIASDLRKIKTKLNAEPREYGQVVDSSFFHNVDRLIYAGDKESARKMLLMEKFNLQSDIERLSGLSLDNSKKVVEKIDAILEKLN